MDLIGDWHALLRPDEELTPRFAPAFAASMRAKKLTFGQRVHCPFLRPFFLTAADEARIRAAAETIALLGERVIRAAFESDDIYHQLGVTEAEDALVDIEPGYPTASTTSRLDAFLLPEALLLRRVQRRVAGRHRLHAAAVRALRRDGGHGQLPRRAPGAVPQGHRLAPRRAHGQLPGVWRHGPAADDGDCRLAGCADLDRVRDPARRLYRGRRADDRLRSSRAGVRQRRADGAGHHGSISVYRRVLVNDILAKPDECRALVDACAARAVCMANSFRCKLAHKKAFFAVLTDPAHESLFSADERAVIQAHVPWTRVLDDVETQKGDWQGDLLALARAWREHLVLKPNDEYGGKGVNLGWEMTEGQWDAALESALDDPYGTWIVQERIPVRREIFPQFDAHGRIDHARHAG